MPPKPPNSRATGRLVQTDQLIAGVVRHRGARGRGGVAVNKSAIVLRGGRGDEALGEGGERNRWPAGLHASGLHLDLN